MKKRAGYVFIIILIVFTATLNVNAFVPYSSYTYNARGKPINCPDAYIPVAAIDGNKLGIGAFSNPADIFVHETENREDIYITDTGNNRIVCCDSEWKIKKIITSFTKDGRIENLNKPESVFVTQDGCIYIGDTQNNRIVELDGNANYVREITLTGKDILKDEYTFHPTRIAVDSGGRIYTLARNTLDGIANFDPNGKFIGFTGANKVKVNLMDFFWKKISVKEEKNRMQLFVPTEFSSIAIDEENFIYTTTAKATSNNSLVRRQNPNGQDIIRNLGYVPLVGDVQRSIQNGEKEPSKFQDVCTQNDGIYSCLDYTRGRIFTYNSLGYLLFVTGGSSQGSQKGMFSNASAIDDDRENLLVLDSKNADITVFKLTEFGKLILDAETLYNNGKYNEAKIKWENVIKLNSNFEYAYSGIGKMLLRQGDYKKAMAYFHLGEDRDGYSKAFKKFRQEWVQKYFGYIIAFFAVAILAIMTIKILLRKAQSKLQEGRISGNILHVFYTSVHPFKGFQEIKQGIKGHHGVSLIIILLMIVVFLIKKCYTGFILNFNNIENMNLATESLKVLVPLALWLTASRALQVFLGGEATFSNIYNSTAVALMPVILVFVLTAVMSNFLTVEEGSIISILDGFGVIWSGILIFASVYTTEDFTVGKTVFAIVCNIVGMALIVFICFIFYNMLLNMFAFLYTLYQEVSLR